MDIAVLIRGAVIGLSIAAPVGPIGVLCIRRTLAEGRVAGLFSGLGAASADAIYGCVAAFGLTFVSSILVGQQVWLRLVGGVFLCVLGARTFLAAPARQGAPAGERGLLGVYLSTFVLTLTNPMTILSFAAIFSGVGLADADANYATAGLLVLGVFLGSALWWLALSCSVGLLRARFGAIGMRWANRASGAIVTGFGVLAVLGVVFGLLRGK